MTHKAIKEIMDTLGLSEADAMMVAGMELGIIGGDVVREGEPEGKELDKAILEGLDKRDTQEGKRHES